MTSCLPQSLENKALFSIGSTLRRNELGPIGAPSFLEVLFLIEKGVKMKRIELLPSSASIRLTLCVQLLQLSQSQKFSKMSKYKL